MHIFEIKSRCSLTWDDIPYIESPVFAYEHVMEAVATYNQFSSSSRVLNIDEFKRSQVPHYDSLFNHDAVSQDLRFLFDNGIYFSVARHGIPFAANFRWRQLDAHPDNGEWFIYHRQHNEVITRQLEDLAKQLGAKKRRMIAERAETDTNLPELISGVRRVAERPVVERPLAKTVAPLQAGEPKNLDDCAQLLAVARERLNIIGYQAKYTDEQQLAKVQNNEVSKERFLVSFQSKNTDPKAKLAFQRESNLVPIWATSFDQLENADTDPKLIADVLGTTYDPSKEYVLHIVDRGEGLDRFGQNTFIPTWDNMQQPTQQYLGGKHDSKILAEVMTPEYQQQYAKDIAVYKESKLNEFKVADQYEYAESLSVNEEKHFLARHNVRTEIGANNEFTGNGLTQSRENSTTYGVVETLTLEVDPPPILAMNNVTTIVLRPRG